MHRSVGMTELMLMHCWTVQRHPIDFCDGSWRILGGWVVMEVFGMGCEPILRNQLCREAFYGGKGGGKLLYCGDHLELLLNG